MTRTWSAHAGDVVHGTLMEQLPGEAHRYMKAEGKQGRRKYLRYGKATYLSTPLRPGLQALAPAPGTGITPAGNGHASPAAKEPDGPVTGVTITLLYIVQDRKRKP